MKVPILVLATPDGIPSRILDLWDQTLFETIRVREHGYKPGSVEEKIRTLHGNILHDHQKTWFQLCRDGFKLDNPDYEGPLRKIVRTIHNDGDSAVVDPLLCFFSPLWCQNMDNCNCLFYYSEPMETAVNLQTKWRFPIHFGLALWEYYVIHGLRNMGAADRALFSLSQFRDTPESYLKATRRRLEGMSGGSATNDRKIGTILRSEWNISAATPDGSRYLSQSQSELFERLESNDLKETEELSVSDQSADILFHYGNIRAGYDQIKGEKESLEKKSGFSQGERPERAARAVTSSDGGSSVPLVEVVVHIDGMAPLEFLVDQDNPIVGTLRDTLLTQSQVPDELVYLYCGESKNTAIYFSARDLLAVETNRALS